GVLICDVLCVHDVLTDALTSDVGTVAGSSYLMFYDAVLNVVECSIRLWIARY
ncbi:hypothetical protein A2U01_0076388, partial [Trifolium medium]|nr:hypothetical protein [Trifolium medium]